MAAMPRVVRYESAQFIFPSHRGVGKILGEAVCLWCVGKAAVRKNANPHALKHALYTD